MGLSIFSMFMNSIVFCSSGYLEILNPIVCLYSIYVMDYFVSSEIAFQFLFHYQTVFSYIFIAIMWVIWFVNHNISRFCQSFSAFPMPRISHAIFFGGVFRPALNGAEVFSFNFTYWSINNFFAFIAFKIFTFFLTKIRMSFNKLTKFISSIDHIVNITSNIGFCK